MRTSSEETCNSLRHKHRPTVVVAWRLYAFASLVPLAIFVDILIGPGSQEPFEPLMGVDFGAFYAGAVMVWQGDTHALGSMDAQREVQRRLQEEERTGWRWYNALPHPPVASLLTAPLAALPLRTAFWVWVTLGLGAAMLAAWLLAKACCPTMPVAATVVLLSFEPIWDVAWWGQIDSFLLLPVAYGVVLLLRGSNRRRDLAAGALLGVLALKPIFVPIPLLVLWWGRRWAAVGMSVGGLLLGIISVAAVGLDGVREYVDLARYYQAFSGSPAIVEWRMYNLRGVAIRLGLGWRGDIQLAVVLAASVALAAAVVVVAARSLRAHRSPDLALGLVVLGTVLTAYHVHVQSLVFLLVPLAVWLGRSLRTATPGMAALWALPVLAIHGGAMLLRPQQPSPAASETRLETYLTFCCLAALVALLVVVARSPIARWSDRTLSET